MPSYRVIFHKETALYREGLRLFVLAPGGKAFTAQVKTLLDKAYRVEKLPANCFVNFLIIDE
jgi:hypothetical protein